MACQVAHLDLYFALEQHCEKVRKARSTVLFRRGQKAFGVFLILRGAVSLDFGVDVSTALTSSCGPGTVIGLPASLTGGNYAMTATVTDDAKLGFLTSKALVSLLRQRPKVREQLVSVLSTKVTHSEQITKALLRDEKVPNVELGPA